jgi:protein PhnA
MGVSHVLSVHVSRLPQRSRLDLARLCRTGSRPSRLRYPPYPRFASEFVRAADAGHTRVPLDSVSPPDGGPVGPYDGEVNETPNDARQNDSLPACPECVSDVTYETGALLACPMCGHEWSPAQEAHDESPRDAVITDAHGTPLSDGDTVTIVKGLKVKGGSSDIKVGTKVRGIRLRAGVGDHDIEARIEGVTMQLKSSVVKKA